MEKSKKAMQEKVNPIHSDEATDDPEHMISSDNDWARKVAEEEAAGLD